MKNASFMRRLPHICTLVHLLVICLLVVATKARDACDDSAGVRACAAAYEYCVKHSSVPPVETAWGHSPDLARQAAEYPELVESLRRKLAASDLCYLCLPQYAVCLREEQCIGPNSTTFARYADQCVNVSQCLSCPFVPEVVKPWSFTDAALGLDRKWILIGSSVFMATVGLFIILTFLC